jgi:PII-like signaling protein
MKGMSLTFFVQENHQLHGKLVFEWLLERAQHIGLSGGSAVRAIAGFGRHGRIHEDSFFELTGDLPVIVAFFVSEEEAARLLAEVEAEKVSLFFVKSAAEFGITSIGGKAI